MGARGPREARRAVGRIRLRGASGGPREAGRAVGLIPLRRPSVGGFRRHRAGEQGRSLPPPAPPASLSLFRSLCRHAKRLTNRGVLSQNGPEKFHWICEPRHIQSHYELGIEVTFWGQET